MAYLILSIAKFRGRGLRVLPTEVDFSAVVSICIPGRYLILWTLEDLSPGPLLCEFSHLKEQPSRATLACRRLRAVLILLLSFHYCDVIQFQY